MHIIDVISNLLIKPITYIHVLLDIIPIPNTTIEHGIIIVNATTYTIYGKEYRVHFLIANDIFIVAKINSTLYMKNHIVPRKCHYAPPVYYIPESLTTSVSLLIDSNINNNEKHIKNHIATATVPA